MNDNNHELTKMAYSLMGNALGSSLAKGVLQMYGGRRGGESILLVEIPFPEHFVADAEGLVRFGKFAMAKAKATGDATWYRAKAFVPNLPMLEGSVGVGPDFGIPMDSVRIYAGMELTLDGFEYSLTKGKGVTP